jgi:hypothetical protein
MSDISSCASSVVVEQTPENDKKDRLGGCWSFYSCLVCFGNDTDDSLGKQSVETIASYEEIGMELELELNEYDCLASPYPLGRN